MWGKWRFVGASMLAVVGLVGASGRKKVQADREVFVSAKELAVNCQAMKDTVGEDYVLGPSARSLSSESARLPAGDMVAVGRCIGYVEGIADEFKEAMGTHYRPTSAGRGELPMLIDAFLKRVADYPNEADLAASTVLHEAEGDVLNKCGDCGFGLFVPSRRSDK